MRYYINGQSATAAQALARINAVSEAHGAITYDVAEMEETARSEEGREYLNELSGYVVEFVKESSMYEVIDAHGKSHGLYESLGEAMGCAEFDRLACFSVWFGDELVAYRGY